MRRRPPRSPLFPYPPLSRSPPAIAQLCSAAATTTAGARQVARRGVDLPVRIGLPGAVTRQKLVRISAGLGLGQSARFLVKQQSMFWRFFMPHGYRPDRLVAGLAPTLGRPAHDLQGFQDRKSVE